MTSVQGAGKGRAHWPLVRDSGGIVFAASKSRGHRSATKHTATLEAGSHRMGLGWRQGVLATVSSRTDSPSMATQALSVWGNSEGRSFSSFGPVSRLPCAAARNVPPAHSRELGTCCFACIEILPRLPTPISVHCRKHATLLLPAPAIRRRCLCGGCPSQTPLIQLGSVVLHPGSSRLPLSLLPSPAV